MSAAKESPKQHLFVLNRNKTVVGLSGHAIEFVKNKPTHVPREMWKDVKAIGAIPENEIEADEDKKDPSEPTDLEARKEAVFGVFEKLALENKRGDFAATGVPHQKAIEKLLGWAPDAKERDALWLEFKTGSKD